MKPNPNPTLTLAPNPNPSPNPNPNLSPNPSPDPNRNLSINPSPNLKAHAEHAILVLAADPRGKAAYLYSPLTYLQPNFHH